MTPLPQVGAARGAPLMVVDLGGEFVKVAAIKAGRTPISIVPNEMSKRRTSAQVAFVDGQRLLGEEAAALGVRYPGRVYARSAPSDSYAYAKVGETAARRPYSRQQQQPPHAAGARTLRMAVRGQ